MLNKRRGVLPLFGLVLAAVSLLIAAVLMWLVMKVFAGVFGWLMLIAGFGFLMWFAYKYMNASNVKPLGNLDYALGIGLPVVFILFGTILSSVFGGVFPAAFLTSAPAAMDLPTVAQSNSPSALSAIDNFSLNLLFWAALIGLIAFIAYYSKKGKR